MLCPVMRELLVPFITLVIVQFHRNWNSPGCSVFQSMDSLSLYNVYFTARMTLAALQASRALALAVEVPALSGMRLLIFSGS